MFLVEKELHDILHGEFPYTKIGLGGKGLQTYNLTQFSVILILETTKYVIISATLYLLKRFLQFIF